MPEWSPRSDLISRAHVCISAATPDNPRALAAWVWRLVFIRLSLRKIIVRKLREKDLLYSLHLMREMSRFNWSASLSKSTTKSIPCGSRQHRLQTPCQRICRFDILFDTAYELQRRVDSHKNTMMLPKVPRLIATLTWPPEIVVFQIFARRSRAGAVFLVLRAPGDQTASGIPNGIEYCLR